MCIYNNANMKAILNKTNKNIKNFIYILKYVFNLVLKITK